MPSPGFVEQVSEELHADPGVEMQLPQYGSGDPWRQEEAATPLVAEALELPEPIVGALSKKQRHAQAQQASAARTWLSKHATPEGSSEKQIEAVLTRWNKVAAYAASMDETSADRVTNASFLRSMLEKHPVMHRLLEEDRATAIPEGEHKTDYEKGRAKRSNRKKRKQDEAAEALEQGQRSLAEDKKKLEEEEKELEERKKKFEETEEAQRKRVKKEELKLSTRAEELDRKEAFLSKKQQQLSVQQARANQAFGDVLAQRTQRRPFGQ